MSYDPVPIYLYYGGTIISDSNGYGYDGARPQILHANPNIRFDELKKKIYSLTKWSEVAYDLEISHRWQAGRGGTLFFVLVPVTDNESLKSVIRNTQSGKLDWSLVELYIEKKSKGAGCSGTAEDGEIGGSFDFDLNPFSQVEIGDGEIYGNMPDEREDVETHDNIPDEREDVIVGEVGRIIVDEVDTFEEARVNNNLDNHDDGEEAFPTIDDDEEEDVQIIRNLKGIEHFDRAAPEYFFDMNFAKSDNRLCSGGNNQEITAFYVGQEFLSRDHLRDSVREWSIAHHRELVTQKSGPTVYTLKCK